MAIACDGTPVLYVWLLLGVFLVAYPLMPQAGPARLFMLGVFGPAALLAIDAFDRQSAEPLFAPLCSHFCGFAALAYVFAWLFNTIALFFGVVAVTVGVVNLVPDESPLVVHWAVRCSAVFAGLVALVFLKARRQNDGKFFLDRWEYVVPPIVGAQLIVSTVVGIAPEVFSGVAEMAFAWALLAAAAGFLSYQNYQDLPPTIVEELLGTGDEATRRYPLLSAITKECGEVTVDYGQFRDQEGSHLKDADAAPRAVAGRSADHQAIIDICRKDPEALERVVYGGGMY